MSTKRLVLMAPKELHAEIRSLDFGSIPVEVEIAAPEGPQNLLLRSDQWIRWDSVDYAALLEKQELVSCCREFLRRPPGWFTNALEDMKDSGRHGLVLVFDEYTLLDMLVELYREGTDKKGLDRVVLMCVKPELADGWIREEGDTVNRVVLDPDGRRISSDTIDIRKQLDEGTLAPDVPGVPPEEAFLELPYGIPKHIEPYEDPCLGCGMAHDPGTFDP